MVHAPCTISHTPICITGCACAHAHARTRRQRVPHHSPMISRTESGRGRSPDFAERYAYARRAQCQVWADEIIDISDESPGLDMAGVAAAKLRTGNRKWILAKLHPELYGDRLQVTGNTGAGPVININLPSKGSAADGAKVTLLVRYWLRLLRKSGRARDLSFGLWLLPHA